MVGGRQTGAEAEVDRIYPGPQSLWRETGNGTASEIPVLNPTDTSLPRRPHLHLHQLGPSIPIYVPVEAILD